MYKEITQCRACGGKSLSEVFDLGYQPLANDFVFPGGERQGLAPLKVMFCPDCTLSQLSVVVDPKILYSNYLYVTSSSDTMLRHFDRLVKDIISENGKGVMVEVGANDGAFLAFAQSKGFEKVIGIDPAANLVGRNGVNIVTGFFDQKTASVAGEKLKSKANVIVARHVFCHLNWQDFIAGITELSNSETLVCIEVPYVADLLHKGEFDTIYHEHTSYLSIRSLVALLKGSPFHIHGIMRYGIHGGSVLVMLRNNESREARHLSADEVLNEENISAKDWQDFSIKANSKIEILRQLVFEAKGKGKIVSMFGASAKSTVLINACGFTEKEISFVTDNTPLKPGRMVPASTIPIIDEGQMLSEHPDFSIMSAWNFKVEILEKQEKWRKRGGKFIIPTGRVEVV
jgi:hypothetical protein